MVITEFNSCEQYYNSLYLGATIARWGDDANFAKLTFTLWGQPAGML